MGHTIDNDSLKYGLAALAAAGSAVALHVIDKHAEKSPSRNGLVVPMTKRSPKPGGRRAHSRRRYSESTYDRSPRRIEDISGGSYSSVGSTRSGDRRSRTPDVASSSSRKTLAPQGRDENPYYSDTASDSQSIERVYAIQRRTSQRDRRSRTPDVASFSRHGTLTPRSREERSYHSDTASGTRSSEPIRTFQRRKLQRDSGVPFPRAEIEFEDEQDDAGITSDEDGYVRTEVSSDDVSSEDEDPIPFPADIYKPLLGRRYIRIIKLFAGKGPAPLRCRLFQISLDNNPPLHFEAISYTWGEEYPRKQLLVHNTNDLSEKPSILTIRLNLYNALRRFRFPDKERWLWTDFVCINQEDKNEREKQVSHMAEVYSEASHTLIWLGNGYKEGLCLRFLARLAYCSPDKHEIKKDIEGLNSEIFPEDGYVPFQSFFGSRNTWFSRRWVIQEVAKSVDSIVYCGTAEPVPWPVFVSGVVRLRLYSPAHFHRVGIDVDILTKIENMDVVWNETQKYGRKFNILHLLTEFHSSECEHNRDKIYALMQLTRTKIEPSLSKKYEQIFKEFAAQCVSREGLGLDLLHCGPAYHHKDEDHDLLWPSWIPDWSQERLFVPLLDISSNGTDSRLKPDVYLVNENEISVRGRILKDYEIRLDFKSRRRLPKKVERVHDWIADVMRTNQSDRFRDIYLERFAQALVAGRTLDTLLVSTLDPTQIQEAEEMKWKHIEAFFELHEYINKVDGPLGAAKPPSSSKIKYSPRARKYAQLVKYTMEGRRVFHLVGKKVGYIAVGPSRIRRGDFIAIFDGAKTPFVIRESKRPGRYLLIGDCYIVALNGEIAQQYPSHNIHLI